MTKENIRNEVEMTITLKGGLMQLGSALLKKGVTQADLAKKGITSADAIKSLVREAGAKIEEKGLNPIPSYTFWDALVDECKTILTA